MIKLLKKAISCLAFTVLLVVLVGGLVAWQSYRIWIQSPGEDGESVEFIVEDGSSFKTVAEKLGDSVCTIL